MQISNIWKTSQACKLGSLTLTCTLPKSGKHCNDMLVMHSCKPPAEHAQKKIWARNSLTCAMHPRRQSSPPGCQSCCTHNVQTLTVAGNEHSDVEALRNRVVNVLLSPCQQDAIQNLHSSKGQASCSAKLCATMWTNCNYIFPLYSRPKLSLFVEIHGSSAACFDIFHFCHVIYHMRPCTMQAEGEEEEEELSSFCRPKG